MNRDRLQELNDSYGSEDGITIELNRMESNISNYTPKSQEGQFLNKIDIIGAQMEQIDRRMDLIAHLHEQALAATSEYRHSQISYERDHLVSDTNELIASIKQNLEHLESPLGDGPELSKSQKVARAMHRHTMANKFSSQLHRYHQIEHEFAQRNRERLERQYRIARPDATDEEISNAIEDENAGRVFAQSVAQSNRAGEGKRVLRDVEMRQAELRRIERTVGEVAALFGEVAAMADRQQEEIDQIEGAVENAYGTVEEANKEMKKSIYYRVKARKKLWILLVLVLVLVAVIVVVVYFTAIKKNGNGNDSSSGSSASSTSSSTSSTSSSAVAHESSTAL